MENQDNNKSNNQIAGYIFVGFMFIGMGLGAAFDRIGEGMFVGMGLGFIASAVYKSEKNKQ